MVPAVEIVEVGPRDGLQNEAKIVPAAQKVELIRRAIAAGVRRIEAASFVNPRRGLSESGTERMIGENTGALKGLKVIELGQLMGDMGADVVKIEPPLVDDPDLPPSRMGVSIGDSLAATYGCMGALAALRVREATGKGQVVDSALYESVLQVMESLVPEYDVMGIMRERSGSFPKGIAPSNVYRCADGEYMIGANGDAIFARLCKAMGRPELASSERYATHAARGTNQIELDALIKGWTSTLTIDQVEALMIAHSIPAGRIFRGPDMLADPHFAAREAIIAVPHPVHGEVRMQNCFPKLSDTPSGVHRTASRSPGEHNAEVYGERLGLSQAALNDLAARGIV